MNVMCDGTHTRGVKPGSQQGYGAIRRLFDDGHVKWTLFFFFSSVLWNDMYEVLVSQQACEPLLSPGRHGNS